MTATLQNLQAVVRSLRDGDLVNAKKNIDLVLKTEPSNAAAKELKIRLESIIKKEGNDDEYEYEYEDGEGESGEQSTTAQDSVDRTEKEEDDKNEEDDVEYEYYDPEPPKLDFSLQHPALRVSGAPPSLPTKDALERLNKALYEDIIRAKAQLEKQQTSQQMKDTTSKKKK
ncbi:MAG: hypothetical protein EZS28_038472 [Streblomastix strix]|uniref:Uncharacterized protein n=1 Tax=Streblomastix strix TaxID=222440 RepID=A0A5J4U7X1_9EUKA|nr:MAG: hypothetical protein EZS28_038472 [Streblomastix strix]